MSELIALPGLEAALEVLQTPKFLQQLQARHQVSAILARLGRAVSAVR